VVVGERRYGGWNSEDGLELDVSQFYSGSFEWRGRLLGEALLKL